jgi:hypothetical protein
MELVARSNETKMFTMDLQNFENFSGRLDADNRAALQVTPLDDYKTGPILVLGLPVPHKGTLCYQRP